MDQWIVLGDASQSIFAQTELISSTVSTWRDGVMAMLWAMPSFIFLAIAGGRESPAERRLGSCKCAGAVTVDMDKGLVEKMTLWGGEWE